MVTPNIRIGIISNADNFIPFTYALAAQGLQVHVFYSPSPDQFINQKVAAFIQQIKIPFTEERNTTKDIYQWLQNGNYNVCFMLGYAHLIKLDCLKNQAVRIFNIHSGALAGFRGPVPVFWQLKKGVKNVGLSIHELSSKFDDGPVVWQHNVPNLPHYNYQIVNDLLGQVCVEGVFYIINLLLQGMPVPHVATGDTRMGYQKRPVLNDVLINWGKMTAVEICNLVRACNPWNKGAVSFFNGQEIKLMDAVIVDDSEDTSLPGTIVSDKCQIHICCADNKIINVNMLFFGNSFIPSYNAREFGLITKTKLG